MIGDHLDGVVNFFKPAGMSSHDAVYFFRRLLGIKKIGHTGTLDPMASGVLPICIGKGTRIAEYLTDSRKEYIGELTLGSKTDTLDSTGSILNSSSLLAGEPEITKAFNNYKGKINQLPPMYSARKVEGKKLYELARQGIVLDRQAREVEIYEMEILKILENQRIIFRTKCSKGTYIRTICDDIGDALGTFGYMSFLLRTQVGGFLINNSLGMDTLKNFNKDELEKIITPMDKALSHLQAVELNVDRYEKLVNGLSTRLGAIYNDYPRNTPLRVYSGSRFVGIGILSEDGSDLSLKMEKVLTR